MKQLLNFLYRSRSSLKPSNYYYSLSTRLQSLSSLFYSTAAAPPPTVAGKNRDDDSLYRRISPVGDWNESVEPILNQWVQEGRIVNKPALHDIIKQLRRYKRYKHALEVSQWMSDKRLFQLTRSDMAVRLDLISRAKGIDQALIYFNDIPEQMKNLEVYGSLHNCYVEENSVEKAEDLMQKMRDLGFLKCALPYNNMLSLYCKTGNFDKLKPLLHEMNEKGIEWDKFTYSILLSTYSTSCSTEEIDVIVQKMESEPQYRLDWDCYTSAADAYQNVGSVDKASMMLKKAEGLIQTSKRKSLGYEFLITHYSAMGNKAEVLRVWEVYQKKGKIYNTGYKSMIMSLLKLDDIIGAENIFEEWEDSQLSYDFRIPNFWISDYCKKRSHGKAEALVERAKQRDKKPLPYTWYYLATGYSGCGQPQKAVEAMKRGISECRPGWLLPSKDILVACLEFGYSLVKSAREITRGKDQKRFYVSPLLKTCKLCCVKLARFNSRMFLSRAPFLNHYKLVSPNWNTALRA